MILDKDVTVFCFLIVFSLLSTCLIYLLTKTNTTKTESRRNKRQILDDAFENINIQVSNIHTMIDRMEWHEERLRAMNKILDERERVRKY